MRKMKVIINPVSGGGLSAKVWKKVEPELIKKGIPYEFEATTKERAARDIAKDAVKQGFHWIVGIGGDGTFSNVINGLFENGKLIHKNVIFSPIPAGRGNDFIKTVKVPKNPIKALEQILNGKERIIDLIAVTYTKADKTKGNYLCLNLADFGMGGEVVYKVNRSKLAHIIGGKGVFLLYSILGLFTYTNKKITLTLSKFEKITNKCRLIVCANGEYAGGGMWFAPKAKLDDGKMDLLAIQDVTVSETLRKFSYLYRGKLSADSKVISKQITELTAESDEDVFIDVDGENMGQLPAHFKVLPNVLPIKC
ncbi:diacylglycerol/lipid kinase family protein [Leptospira meyeri]|uniref:diacylglycerol/lipid kinase family protein n=1 Tax=Leptospira meyeri TaxID=29508 RepID=UPI000C299F62|nr:diacylglycerol kinase family protein [Leptospira meyeri]PKA25045.1 sphingosine kinase [Leptospira sp. mixed culture ATI2-C-A1]MCW7490783.1 diacylglycerol kinase family lipid kinase [Leptospira meyeri]TGM21682.1 diacylglycerol kinase family lipid kinase [Leptospira meyeri]TGM61142.1 diacylglycerol kinase family lipid kinase [Leptospira meyeri]TGM65968.1 diacylglycerol kinase family lipid kinase [Leptospira meyeri]